MEAVSPATAPEGADAGADPAGASSVKSDDSTPPHDGGRGSPPPNCAICLGTCRNKCFTDSCLHQFCFKCLLTWSKVKAECPLCKQNFKSIIHNVRSNHQYEEYLVEQRHTAASPDPAHDLTSATRRFRYRTTLTLPRRDSLAIQHLLLHYPLVAGVAGVAGVGGVLGGAEGAGAGAARRRRSPAAFRRTVYRHNLWARPLPDFTGRYRDCSPDFYRRNDSQMHRLVPWLNRELHYLLNENVGHISYVMARILELLQRHHINSAEFTEAVRRYFGDRTEHFLHELYCFASTPYDMTGYDRQVQYTTDARISTVVNEIISSTDSDASVDSDIVMVSAALPADPPPGPSRPAPAPRVVPIETVSHSGSDDDEEVVVVGYIKPPADRTPEVVDLVGSDSDVIVQEAEEPEPAPAPAPRDRLVKLSLTRRRPPAPSDSDDSGDAGDPRPRRKRRRSGTPGTPDATYTPDTEDSEDSGSDTRSSGAGESAPEPGSPRPASEPATPPPAPPAPATPPAQSSSASPTRRRREHDKARRKASRRRSPRERRDSARRERPERPERPERAPRKSHAGKGVKRSRPEPEAGPSSARRLRSVVTVARPAGDAADLLSVLSGAILNPNSNVLAYTGAGSRAGEGVRDPRAQRLLRKADACFATRDADSGSDPEDDLPLNLSVHRAPEL